MQKIASNGATVTNEFTEGNAALSIPATVVSGDWLNSVQHEIVAVVQAAGITLGTPGADPGNQMLAAILQLIQQGGQSAALSVAIANNQAALTDVTGFPQIDVTKVRSFEAFITLVRRTDSAGFLKQTGRLYATWLTAAELGTANGAWDISIVAAFDSAGVDFTMTLVGGNIWKLQYQSDNMAGASYSGSLKVSNVIFDLF